MTGPENYDEAQRLLADGLDCACPRADCEHAAVVLARAQVHATLALAAATALKVTTPEGMNSADKQAWREAAATPQKPRAVA
jgi:hypothetical protein